MRSPCGFVGPLLLLGLALLGGDLCRGGVSGTGLQPPTAGGRASGAGNDATRTPPTTADKQPPLPPLSSHAYVVIVVDLRRNKGICFANLVAVQAARQFARKAGVPDDHIITIAPFSAQWIKHTLLPTAAGLDASTLPGACSTQVCDGKPPTAASVSLLLEYANLYFDRDFEEAESPAASARPGLAGRLERILAQYKQAGVDLLEEFDFAGEQLFTSATLSGILNGECPGGSGGASGGGGSWLKPWTWGKQQSVAPAWAPRPDGACKVVPKPTHAGETHSVLVWTVLHGSDPFATTASPAQEIKKLDVLGLLPDDTQDKIELVDYPTEDASLMYFNDKDQLRPTAVRSLFTDAISNAAVQQGRLVVVISSCYGASLVRTAFPKLTAKYDRSMKVSALADRPRAKPGVQTAHDKVLFFAFSDRYAALVTDAMQLLKRFAHSLRPEVTFGAVAAQARDQVRADAGQDPHVLAAVLGVLSSPLVEQITHIIDTGRDKLLGDLTAEAEAQVKPLKADLQSQLKNAGWQWLPLTKKFSIVATLSNKLQGRRNQRVRLAGRLPQGQTVAVSIYGDRDLADAKLVDFFANR